MVGAFVGPASLALSRTHCVLPSLEATVAGNTPTLEAPALTHSDAGKETGILQPVGEYVT